MTKYNSVTVVDRTLLHEHRFGKCKVTLNSSPISATVVTDDGQLFTFFNPVYVGGIVTPEPPTPETDSTLSDAEVAVRLGL